MGRKQCCHAAYRTPGPPEPPLVPVPCVPWAARRALIPRLLDSGRPPSPKVLDEKLAARSDPHDPGESRPFARARGQPVLQLASPDSRTFRRSRSGTVETDERQPAPDAALPESEESRAPRRRPGVPRALRQGPAYTRFLPAPGGRRGQPGRVLLCRVRLSRELPDLLGRPRRAGWRLLQGRE